MGFSERVDTILNRTKMNCSFLAKVWTSFCQLACNLNLVQFVSDSQDLVVRVMSQLSLHVI